MKFIKILVMQLLPLAVLGQYGKDIHVINNRVIVNYSESTVYAFVLPNKHNRKTNDEYFYYWFASNDIKQTRGAYDGKLLHGPYTEFYLNKDLKEKGKVRYGLKQGVWRSWYPNGEYREVVRYRNSERIRHTEFYENGNLKSIGKYKDNKLHGRVKTYTLNGKKINIKYKNGEPVIHLEKEKKNKKKGFSLLKKKNKAAADSLQTSSTPKKGTKKKGFSLFKSKKKKQENNEQLQPGNPSNPGTVPGNTSKKKKGKPQDGEIRMRKFLWIIPLEQAPVKGKQT